MTRSPSDYQLLALASLVVCHVCIPLEWTIGCAIFYPGGNDGLGLEARLALRRWYRMDPKNSLVV